MDIDIINMIVSNSNKAVEKLSSQDKVSKLKKDYYDEYLTGLTEDEKKEIEKRIEAYVKEKKIDFNNKSDIENLKDFIAGLLKQFGFKGDIEEMADGMAFKAALDREKEVKELNEDNNINIIKSAYYNEISNPNKFNIKNKIA